jgi:hypothetical protein
MVSITFYNLLKVLHILAAVGFAGGIFARQIVRRYAKATDDVVRFATLNEAAFHIENWLVKPGSFVILAFGSRWRRGVFIPRSKRFRPLLDAALAQRRMTPELKAALNDPVVGAAHNYEIGMLIVLVALMTLKPS